ncbi:MAG TPA: S16 family serine protease [Ilumatobacteraceae bacterium]
MSDTQNEIVPLTPVPGGAPRRRRPYWAFAMAGIGFGALALIFVSTLFTASRFTQIKRPYAIVPADAQQVESRVSFDGPTRYPATGQILFVTIREPQLSLLSWFMFHRDKDIDGLTYNDVYPNITPAQAAVSGQREMNTAQQLSEYTALSKLGFPVQIKDGAVVINYILCIKNNAANTACAEFAPAGKVLQAGDELVSLDGKAIKVVDDVTAALANHKPGDMVQVKYNRAGVSGVQTGTIELTSSPDAPGKTLVGFNPFDTRQVSQSPFPINISTTDIGGPSAGLAFTLTLIDELTPGDLTGGKRIAVTGTIDIDGKVGAIGGLPQKASAVMQTGTKYFLVPASQSKADIAAARKVVGDKVQIIPVATLDEALAAMTKLGGNGANLPQVGTGYKAPAS